MLERPNPSMRLAIGFATRGRAAVLRETLAGLRDQTRVPDRVVVCHTMAEDVAGIEAGPGIEFLRAPAGLPKQRNRILDAVRDCDLLLFLDDDFLMARRYVEATAAIFAEHPDIVATTGTTIADGIKGPGLTPAAGRALIAAEGDPALDLGFAPAPHGYGCNMAIRIETARQHAVWFDEKLPLYAWSEDVDYTHRLGRYGVIAKLRGARGVHLGVKSGRSPGRNLGYSQVANPIYLRRKGSYSWSRALGSVGRNLVANCLKAAWPEKYIDRRGRLLGNALALRDLARGRLSPERVLEL